MDIIGIFAQCKVTTSRPDMPEQTDPTSGPFTELQQFQEPKLSTATFQKYPKTIWDCGSQAHVQSFI